MSREQMIHEAAMQGFSTNMAKFYGMPSRGGGCQTDAPVINCQAGYESMLTFYSAYSHGINIVMEAGGVMDSVNSTSIQKMIVDFEIIRQVKAACAPIEVNEETLNVEEIKEIGHNGSFITADSTMEHFGDLYSPKVGPRNAKSDTYFEDSIEKEIQRLLEEYEENRPVNDPAAMEKVRGVLMGICSFWLGIVPDKTSIIIIHLLYGVGTSFMIWSAYLKLTRKMGNEKEQGRMFSTSEFVRGIFGMLIGFAGVALLGQATLGSGELDPADLGVQWRNLMWISGALFLIFALLVLLFIPAKVTGAEETGSEVQEAFSLKNVVKVLKMPGTWLISALVFCCFSFTSAGNGYLGPYTVNVLGVSETMASSFAIVRNYIIAAVMTLAIDFISDKIGSKAKTLGIYLAIASVLGAALVFTKSAFALCLVISFAFAIVYSGMRGIYFATLNEVGIPLSMTGIATGIISMLCYLPDVYFAKLAGTWLDHYGNAGYDMIWYWAIGCGVIGVVAAVLVLADLAFCFGVGIKTRGGSSTAAEYFIGDKKIGPVLLFLTAWASFSGAGNFIGQAGREPRSWAWPMCWSWSSASITGSRSSSAA